MGVELLLSLGWLSVLLNQFSLEMMMNLNPFDVFQLTYFMEIRGMHNFLKFLITVPIKWLEKQIFISRAISCLIPNHFFFLDITQSLKKQLFIQTIALAHSSNIFFLTMLKKKNPHNITRKRQLFPSRMRLMVSILFVGENFLLVFLKLFI